LVHARGGDGQTPLHFASTVEIAEFLLAHGAAIDARDVDHEAHALRVDHDAVELRDGGARVVSGLGDPRAEVTVGEISNKLRSVWGEYREAVTV